MSRPRDALYRPGRPIRRIAGPVFAAACLAATFTGVLVLALMLGSLLTTARRFPDLGPPAVKANDTPGFLAWLLGRTHNTITASRAGYRVGVVSSLWLLGLTALFGVPIGVAAGVYLEEYAPDGPWKRVIQTNIANLAGVPSIVYGILGLMVFVRVLGYSAWAGALTLALLVQPVILVTTREALRTVPESLRQGALALGASKWQMIRDHVLPTAMPGILTGVILSLSRAIGETAPVLMVIRATSLVSPPRGPGDDYVPLPVEIYDYASQPIGSGFEVVASGGILILLGLLLTMNAVAIAIRNRYAGRPGSDEVVMSVSEIRPQPQPPAPDPPPSPLEGPPRPPAEAAEPPVIAVEGLSAWYGQALALQDIALVVPRHRITALIGPSGCGKSTLLRCFNRMNDLIPSFRMEGRLTFDGEDLAAVSDVVALRRRVGMVFQKPNPFPKSIYNNVAWGARINGYRGDMDELVERSLRRAALWDEVKNKLGRSGLELSGGQQQRLCIARTLAVEPEVILMDEPCSALDPISTGAIEDLIDDLKSEYTIVIVTHNLGQARRASDVTACFMVDESASREGYRVGVLAEFRPTDEIFTNPRDPRVEAYITGRIG